MIIPEKYWGNIINGEYLCHLYHSWSGQHSVRSAMLPSNHKAMTVVCDVYEYHHHKSTRACTLSMAVIDVHSLWPLTLKIDMATWPFFKFDMRHET